MNAPLSARRLIATNRARVSFMKEAMRVHRARMAFKETVLGAIMEGPAVPVSMVGVAYRDSWEVWGVQLHDDTIAWFCGPRFVRWGRVGEPPPM